jgi:hypothetical protein
MFVNFKHTTNDIWQGNEKNLVHYDIGQVALNNREQLACIQGKEERAETGSLWYAIFHFKPSREVSPLIDIVVFGIPEIPKSV